MYLQEQELHQYLEAFLLDRRAQNFTPGTVKFYHEKLRFFVDRFNDVPITEITPTELRQFFLDMSISHNPGGVHCIYRTVKTFLRWYEMEFEPDGWRNPINKVKAPKLPLEPLEPVPLQNIGEMLKYSKARDKAILLCLLDTGARAMEFLNMNLADVNQLAGEILIRQGKGGKPRFVYLGAKSRKALRNYLKQRTDNSNTLWVTDDGTKLTYPGLRMILKRRADQVGISAPSIHSFRRAFAIGMLRSGCDLVTLANLMGHSSLSVLQRYLKQDNADLRKAHRLAGPVDDNF